MTSMPQLFENETRVYGAELVCSTGVSGSQTFKLVFCINNKHEPCASWSNNSAFSKKYT